MMGPGVGAGGPIYRTTRAYAFDGPPGHGPPPPWGMGPPGGPGFGGPMGGRGGGRGFGGGPPPRVSTFTCVFAGLLPARGQIQVATVVVDISSLAHHLVCLCGHIRRVGDPISLWVLDLGPQAPGNMCCQVALTHAPPPSHVCLSVHVAGWCAYAPLGA